MDTHRELCRMFLGAMWAGYHYPVLLHQWKGIIFRSLTFAADGWMFFAHQFFLSRRNFREGQPVSSVSTHEKNCTPVGAFVFSAGNGMPFNTH
jgi:hypothetical protein